MASGIEDVHHSKKMHGHDSKVQEQGSFSSQTLNASSRLEEIALVCHGYSWDIREEEHSHCPKKSCLRPRKRKWNGTHHWLHTPMVVKYFEDLGTPALDEESTSMAE